MNAHCNAPQCLARAEGTREAIEALGWLPCPRKGGRLEWICPDHRPKGKPGMGLSTGKF